MIKHMMNSQSDPISYRILHSSICLNIPFECQNVIAWGHHVFGRDSQGRGCGFGNRLPFCCRCTFESTGGLTCMQNFKIVVNVRCRRSNSKSYRHGKYILLNCESKFVVHWFIKVTCLCCVNLFKVVIKSVQYRQQVVHGLFIRRGKLI